MSDRYVVEEEKAACGHCGLGAEWTVVDTKEDCAIGIGWLDKEPAEEVAALMNQAHETALREEAEIIQRFIDSRGRHEGVHDFGDAGICCKRCEAAYTEAEAVLDSDLASLRASFDQSGWIPPGVSREGDRPCQPPAGLIKGER
jgi:hypothetical protein